ncbi:hypothetical protein Anapl_13619 [Anas platyrhynchos]|uniref:Uncharacterized protein n=1 Tax=Anas platyrhynchos TaxID=8839 RepID=R0M808_ANAPL|nr:hypothetical protein Anapl_13619 [Anas platyrhynchos]
MKSCFGVTGTGGSNGEVVLGFDSLPGEARDSKAGEPDRLVFSKVRSTHRKDQWAPKPAYGTGQKSEPSSKKYVQQDKCTWTQKCSLFSHKNEEAGLVSKSKNAPSVQLYIGVLQALDKAAALAVSMDVPAGGGKFSDHRGEEPGLGLPLARSLAWVLMPGPALGVPTAPGPREPQPLLCPDSNVRFTSSDICNRSVQCIFLLQQMD